MTIQYSTSLRNAQLDAIGAKFNYVFSGVSIMKIYTGVAPATADLTATGTLLLTMSLPSTPFSPASGGGKAKLGTWTADVSATGTAGYFRINDDTGQYVAQGTIGLAGSGADMTVDTATFTAGQNFTVTSFALTTGQA